MTLDYTFPFGQKVDTVEQTDRTPKKVFVLGVYASAVHAKWISRTNRVVVQALAVASEPAIFWRGGNAGEIVGAISIPPVLGHLEASSPSFNGPSGRALDEHFLDPLGIDRKDTWLCDLVPHTCLNRAQLAAITKRYDGVRRKHQLPQVTVPPVPKRFADDNRRNQILDEIRLARPRLTILLGDQPVRWFLSTFCPHKRLSEFGTSKSLYGRVHRFAIDSIEYSFLPLVHPRQAGALSAHSAGWKNAHRIWTERRAKEIAHEHLAF